MAGFNTLGSTVNQNIGGSFNPALNNAGSGQSSPSGFGTQPPRLSTPFNVGALSLGAGQRPDPQSDIWNRSANVYTPGPDTSGQHLANVMMAQQGYGDLGLRDQTPGTSYSGYGFSPQSWGDISRYVGNPQNQGNVDAYKNIMDIIHQSMGGNPMFSGWQPEQMQQFYTDMPLRYGAAFNIFPPEMLQNIGMGTGMIPGIRGF